MSANEQLEYEQCLEMFRHRTVLRRQGMAFVTTVHGATVAIESGQLLALEASGVALVLLAIFVALLGLNNELRLAAYMKAHGKRAQEIEKCVGIQLVTASISAIKEKPYILSNMVMFPLFYIVLLIGWVSMLAYNVGK